MMRMKTMVVLGTRQTRLWMVSCDTGCVRGESRRLQLQLRTQSICTSRHLVGFICACRTHLLRTYHTCAVFDLVLFAVGLVFLHPSPRCFCCLCGFTWPNISSLHRTQSSAVRTQTHDLTNCFTKHCRWVFSQATSRTRRALSSSDQTAEANAQLASLHEVSTAADLAALGRRSEAAPLLERAVEICAGSMGQDSALARAAVHRYGAPYA